MPGKGDGDTWRRPLVIPSAERIRIRGTSCKRDEPSSQLRFLDSRYLRSEYDRRVFRRLFRRLPCYRRRRRNLANRLRQPLVQRRRLEISLRTLEFSLANESILLPKSRC